MEMEDHKKKVLLMEARIKKLELEELKAKRRILEAKR